LDEKMTEELSVGSYAEWKGYGLVKIVGKENYNDAMAGKIFIYKVKTGVASPGFSFGIKTAHRHELRPVTNSDAQKYIQQMKEIREERKRNSF
jgi:hypothetical protein